LARELLWSALVLRFIALLAAQTPDVLDLVDRLDVLSLSDAATVESLIAEDTPTSTDLQIDLGDLPTMPSRRRAVGLVVRYFDAWREAIDYAQRDRRLEVVLVFDLAAWWLASPDPIAPPLLERERQARCDSLPNFGSTPLLVAYYQASWRALGCSEVGP
jgi:hypothetical protein